MQTEKISIEEMVRQIIAAVMADPALYESVRHGTNPQTFTGSDLVRPANVLAQFFKDRNYNDIKAVLKEAFGIKTGTDEGPNEYVKVLFDEASEDAAVRLYHLLVGLINEPTVPVVKPAVKRWCRAEDPLNLDKWATANLPEVRLVVAFGNTEGTVKDPTGYPHHVQVTYQNTPEGRLVSEVVCTPEKPRIVGLVRDNPETSEGKYLVKRRDGSVPPWPSFVLGGSDPHAAVALRAYADSIAQDPDCYPDFPKRLRDRDHFELVF